MIEQITIYVDGNPFIRALREDMENPRECAIAISSHFPWAYVILSFHNGYCAFREGAQTRLMTYG